MVGYNDRLARVTNAAKYNDGSKPVKMQMSKQHSALPKHGKSARYDKNNERRS